MATWLFPLRGAARKDNVSSDIPAHWPALITPPSSSGGFRMPDATRTQLTEMVVWTLWCHWKNDQSLPTNFDRKIKLWNWANRIQLWDIIGRESHFLPKRLDKVEVPYTGIAGFWEPGHRRLSDVNTQIEFITTRGSSHDLFDMLADVYKCSL